MKLEFWIGKLRIGINASIKYYKQHTIKGISNRTKDGMYVLFIEYDHLELKDIINELIRLQKSFHLSDFYIFKSNKGNNYHTYCFDKLMYREFRPIIEQTTTDKNWYVYPLRYGTKKWVLRLTEKFGFKPKHIYTLKSPYHIREKSTPHLQLISSYFNIELNDENKDEQKTLEQATYTI